MDVFVILQSNQSSQINKYFYGYCVWVLVGFFYSSNKSTFTRNNNNNLFNNSLFYKQLFYQYKQVYNVVNQLSCMWMCPGE